MGCMEVSRDKGIDNFYSLHSWLGLACLALFGIQLLGERQSPNVLRFLEAINGRPDITDGLRKLQCRSLIFVGENSPFHYEALYMTSKLDRRFTALVEIYASSTSNAFLTCSSSDFTEFKRRNR